MTKSNKTRHSSTLRHILRDAVNDISKSQFQWGFQITQRLREREDLCAEGRPGRPAGVALLKLAGDKIVSYMNMLHLHPLTKFKMQEIKLLVALKLCLCGREWLVTGQKH